MITFIQWALLALLTFVLITYLILNKGKNKKIYLFILIFLVCLVVYMYRDLVLSFLESLPYAGWIVKVIATEIANKTLLGAFFITLLGGLFFLGVPLEVSLTLALSFKHNPLFILPIALAGFLIGMTIDYFIGYLAGERILRFFLKEKFDKMKKTSDKFGGWIILFGNMIIFPNEILAVLFGASKYKFRKFIMFALIGAAVKFTIIYFARDYVTTTLIPFFSKWF